MATPIQDSPSELDVIRVRQDFPILQRAVRDKPLVYLDSAATTQKPKQVLDVLANYYAQQNANIHRGVYVLSAEAAAAYDEARRKVQHFVNARSAQEVILPGTLPRASTWWRTVLAAKMLGQVTKF